MRTRAKLSLQAGLRLRNSKKKPHGTRFSWKTELTQELRSNFNLHTKHKLARAPELSTYLEPTRDIDPSGFLRGSRVASISRDGSVLSSILTGTLPGPSRDFVLVPGRSRVGFACNAFELRKKVSVTYIVNGHKN